MSYDTSIAIQHVTSDHAASSDGDEPHRVLEVQLRFSVHLMSTVTNSVVFESSPVPLATAVLSLPIHKLNDDPILFQTYIADQLLESLNITAPSSDIIVDRIASYIVQLTQGSKDMDIRVIAVVDHVYRTSQLVFEIEGPVPMGVELIPTTEIFRMEKLEENGEGLGSCCICLDEIDCKETNVVRVPCGHVYHKSCLSEWLCSSNSCPLCRTSLPIDQLFSEFINEEDLYLGIANGSYHSLEDVE